WAVAVPVSRLDEPLPTGFQQERYEPTEEEPSEFVAPSNLQRPNLQPPTSNLQPPTSNLQPLRPRRPSAIGHRSSAAIDHRPSTIDHRPSVIGHRSALFSARRGPTPGSRALGNFVAARGPQALRTPPVPPPISPPRSPPTPS